MKSGTRWLVLPITLVAVLALGMPPSFADHATRQDVKNLIPVADIENSDPFPINSDMAFWGDLAFQGNFQGFQIHDISDPTNPVNLVDIENCPDGQGDVFVWEDLLVYSRNSPVGSGGASCDGDALPVGFEGVHIWDVSNPLNPTKIHSVPITGMGDGLPAEVVVAAGAGAGTYEGHKATFGAVLEAGVPVTGTLEIVNDGVAGGTVNDGCEPFSLANEAPAGPQDTIAIIDRGFCDFVTKATNAEDAGAEGVIIVNNQAGAPTQMGGTPEDPSDTDGLTVHVSDVDGADIKTSAGEEATLQWDGTTLSGCGSHTLTGVPDLGAGLLRVYVGGSSTTCPGMDLVEIPLADPTTATWTGLAVANRSCHDITVYLIDKNRAACSGSWEGEHGYTYFSMDAADGGSLADPILMYERNMEGTFTIGHTTGFSWDGKYLYWSHEPGGGTAAQCETSDPITNRQMWIFRAERGNELGRWTIPSQSAQENCASVHIMQSIPTVNGSYVLSTGTYQAGTYVLDVTDPEFAHAIGWSDPPARVPTTLLAGAWATYWYNGFLYESDILFGLHIHRSTSPQAQTPVRLDFLNPQTMMPLPAVQARCRGQEATHVGTNGPDTITGTGGRDVIVARGGRDLIRGRGGHDLICAGPGVDTVRGNAGNDRILGQGGRDTLFGNKGNDRLNGGAARDSCFGGPGRDRARNCERTRGIP